MMTLNEFRASLQHGAVQRSVDDILRTVEDGELYLESDRSTSYILDDGVLKSTAYHTHQGFGLRAVVGSTLAYAASDLLSAQAVKQAGENFTLLPHAVPSTTLTTTPVAPLYADEDPTVLFPPTQAVPLLQAIDSFTRGLNPLVRQVSVALQADYKEVDIYRPGSSMFSDKRPMVRVHISVVVEQAGRRETGNARYGTRGCFASLLQTSLWQNLAREAVRQALVNLEARPAPAGVMTVVLGAGMPAVLLHEAVGHGLEGDFNRKKLSAFSGLMGQQVAAKGVTVIDDGTIPNAWGSLTIDDEGTPTQRNVLIEDGVLVGYLQDRQNARLMGVQPTGSGRRENYTHHPMPRMNNTLLLGGQYAPDEIIASVKNGVYATNFSGGEVDITSGQFVFNASEAYRLENGRVTYPLKGMTLIGKGVDVMRAISMIGNDASTTPDIGYCGKDGQSVPVGLGQPTVRVDGLTVGGTEIQ